MQYRFIIVLGPFFIDLKLFRPRDLTIRWRIIFFTFSRPGITKIHVLFLCGGGWVGGGPEAGQIV